MNAKRFLLIPMLLALSLAATACGIMSVSTEGGELTVTVNLNEDQVNSIIRRVNDAGRNGDDFLFSEISSVDLMEPNVIRVFGTTADGASGSYDATIGVVDESLKIEVTAVDVPGVTLDDPRVQAANDELAQAFLDNARSNGEGSVAGVAVVGDELRFTIKAPLSR